MSGYTPSEKPGTDTTGLVLGILVTLFCCLPFGIVAIVKAVQGDGAGAKKWAGIGAAVGVVLIVLYIILIAVGAVSMGGSTTTY
ncbi:CD225/dispanin family protein [Nocardioides sp. NPDC057772]|uniref:CD225/dispanin family protein n=1 Tax=Nocardioides turkmenicus TaxID=2711220 RepID=A0A6M1QP32_9ACTN|nr:CD225/dispanin family protein [Nocardioides sp. KC13]NGN91445.1 CD225/dispanin family protein [Nocardioides sp. KC13]